MKLSAKPISSPARADKFPPPLLRFLKSNGSSRSRGRSRTSSPIFIRKKSERNQVQEPSSPKVTCMGQVQVSSTKKEEKKKKKKKPISRNRKGIHERLFCCNFDEKSKFKIWGFPIRKEKVEIKVESMKREAKPEIEVKEEIFVASTTPPKNAFLLTRCRSEPYRSSSLANRFWGSPFVTNEEGLEQKHEEEEESKTPISEKETNSRGLGFCESLERSLSDQERRGGGGTSTEISTKFEVAETSKKVLLPAVHPLLLTRCKSEPVRRSEKFQVEMSFGVGLI